MGNGQKIYRYQLDQWLKDYHWMILEIRRFRELSKEGKEKSTYHNIKTSQWGEEAVMPKASGGNFDAVSFEACRRANFFSEKIKYERYVREIQKRIRYVTGERELFVLNRLLDGSSMRKIAQDMGFSEATIRRIRENILDMMFEVKD